MDKSGTAQFRSGRNSRAFSSLSQSLSFHASPHSFLAGDPALDRSASLGAVPNFVRAKILNRDVTVISSYQHCHEVLHGGTVKEALVTSRDGSPVSPNTFTVAPAYRELMADFFPRPNVLLLDPPEHESARQKWDSHMADVSACIPGLVRDCVEEHIAHAWTPGTTINLYKDMKDLAWEILCAVFLGHSPTEDSTEYNKHVSLQETLLRGQFSLFPVSVRTPFWQSPRSRGLDASAKLLSNLRAGVASPVPGCPFAQCNTGELDDADRAGNLLLFTSSIAVKALSSLLTASLLNVFLFPHGDSSLADWLRSQDATQREATLDSILRETERLSPPVIGVMRRVEQDIQLCSSKVQPSESVVVPKGWDVWLYFVAASRDETVYQQANRFVPERFLNQSEPEAGFAFGDGRKECLGKETSRLIVKTVASVLLDGGWDLDGSIDRAGVRTWLGWEDTASNEVMAKDMKQLPSQRPREPIRLQVRRRS